MGGGLISSVFHAAASPSGSYGGYASPVAGGKNRKEVFSEEGGRFVLRSVSTVTGASIHSGASHAAANLCFVLATLGIVLTIFNKELHSLPIERERRISQGGVGCDRRCEVAWNPCDGGGAGQFKVGCSIRNLLFYAHARKQSEAHKCVRDS